MPKISLRELDDLLAITDEINDSIEAGNEPSQRIVEAANRLREEIARDTAWRPLPDAPEGK